MISQRQALQLLERFLCVVCGWYWFGASGAALLALWFAARPFATPVPVETFLAALDTAESGFVHLTQLRLLLVHPRLGRLEIFRDEVGASRWAELKRRCVSQPATGRKTSI